MHYLIDGHNLVAAMTSISIEDPNDEVLLVLRLRSWAAGGQKRKVTVVFDRGLPGGRSRSLSTGQVNVLFAPEGQTADAVLIRRIDQAPNPAEFTLISSDRQVQNAARARGMKYHTAKTFAQRISNPGKTAANAQPTAEAEDPVLSQEEIALWLELFEAAPKIRPEPKEDGLRPRPQQEDSNAKEGQRKRAGAADMPDPANLKAGDRMMSGDEVDEWLKLFGQDRDD